MKSPIILLRSLLNDFDRLLAGVPGLDRDYSTIKNRFEHEGFSFLSVTLPSLCDALDLGLATGKFDRPSSFKKMGKGELPAFLQGFLIEVFDKQGRLKEEPSVEHIKCLRELLRLFKKTELDATSHEKLVEQTVDKFFKTEEVLSGINFDPRKTHLLGLVAKFILPTVDTYDQDRVYTRHGPGGVYEKVAGNGKWKLLTRVFQTTVFSNWFFTPYVSSSHELPKDEWDTYSPVGGVSRLICVPKTSTSLRTITVEPLLLQYLQQGLNRHLREEITRCSVLSRCLKLTDQSENQKLALEGSLTGEWATIDLSSASDLLSTDVVKLVFQHRPAFLEQAMSCRSSFVEYGKRRVRLRKFAGMGNALTFPVQSTCFATLCIAAVHDALGLKPTMETCRRIASELRVYGDDIIVPTKFYTSVETWISSFSLIVNRRKTFAEGYFRESCGVDAYKGHDVTPTYVRTYPGTSFLKEASNLLSLVSTSNQLWSKCLYEASQYLANQCEDALKRKLPLVSSASGLLGWHDRYGSTEVHGWNSDTQVPIVRGLTQRPNKVADVIDGYAALIKFFHTPLIERNDGHLTRSPKRFSVRIVKGWAPANAG